MTIPGILAGASVGNRWCGTWQRWDSRPGTRDSTGRGRDRDEDQGPGTRDSYVPMIPLGQFRDTFIIAVDDEGVAIIDQHVAHERVLFEQVMERLTAGAWRASGC